MIQSDAALAALRPDLLRFARLQLRDDALAEDVVQDALIAAMGGIDNFAGRAALKTWMFSILKNKIVDALRSRERTVNVSALGDEEADFEQVFDTLFKANGHWLPGHQPAVWGDPEADLDREQFWRVFDACLNHLPAKTGRVFAMREFLDLDIEEICRELGIGTNNCYVILHRARHQLRACLEKTWFGQGK
ncbi:MAG: sigma-70 family RNA polymerase sigma factor [Rhodocyclaceae bacterium]